MATPQLRIHKHQTCEQPQVDLFPESLVIIFRGRSMRVRPMEMIVLTYVRQNGSFSYGELLREIARCRSEGGSSYASLGVMLHQMKKRIRPIGLGIERLPSAWREQKNTRFRICILES